MPTGNVSIVNGSVDDVLLTRRGETSGTTLKPGARTTISVSVGDVFDVSFPARPELRYRPVFVSDLAQPITIYPGKVPLRAAGQFGTFRLLRCQQSLCGFDIKKITPRVVLDGFLPEPIFEPLSTESITYEIAAPFFTPQGFFYTPKSLSQGSSTVKLTYSYAAFANEWSLDIGAGGKTPSGAGGKLDIGYNQFDNSERSNTNVYASTREQKALYQVNLDPKKTYLSPDFMAAVESVTTAEEAKTAIIARYGTHFATSILYGGDRSVFMIMQEDTYATATGFGVSVKAEVSKSQDMITGSKESSKGNAAGDLTERSMEQTTGSSEVASGKLGFEYSQNESVKQLSSMTTNGYQIVGGTGGFDSWSVLEDNASAVAVVDSDYLYNLVRPEVFKNGTPAAVLDAKRDLIRKAINAYVADMPSLTSPAPAPRTYSVTLASLEVTEEIDDANKKTKGIVQAAVVNQKDMVFDGTLWNYADFSEAGLKYVKGQKATPNTKKTLFYPPVDGTFDPLQVTVSASIYEQDDVVGGQQLHSGNSGVIDVSDLEEGEKLDFSFDCSAFATWAARGTIRVSGSVAREISEFENPLLSSPLFSLESNLGGRTLPRFKLFKAVGAPGAHPSTTLKVDTGYKIISGGARVTYNANGNLLTASYPQDSRTWVARSKDHQTSSPASIYVYAIAIYDPNNEWDVRIFPATSGAANHPSAKAAVGAGYVLTGGGAQSHWQGAGNMLTASYPDPANAVPTSWVASSKDHLQADATTITAYAIGVKPPAGAILTTKVFSKTSESASHPSTIANVAPGYTLLGGGARVSTSGPGNLLVKSFPDGIGWKAGSKDHLQASAGTVTAYAIGLKNDV